MYSRLAVYKTHLEKFHCFLTLFQKVSLIFLKVSYPQEYMETTPVYMACLNIYISIVDAIQIFFQFIQENQLFMIFQ